MKNEKKLAIALSLSYCVLLVTSCSFSFIDEKMEALGENNPK